MEIYNVNPSIKNILVEYHNEKPKLKKENNWKKAIIVVAGSTSIMPIDLGNIQTQTTAKQSQGVLLTANIVDWELTHFGAKPSVAKLEAAISGFLTGFDLSIILFLVPLIADAILASGAISIGSITDTIIVIIAGVSLGPISTAAITGLAASIVAF